MVTCASDLLTNPAKVPYFQYKAWWYSIVQKFHNDGKKFKNHNFEFIFAYGHDPAIKSQKFKIGHDSILLIGNFILMIKNNIFLFQLPDNWPTTKKCALYFRGNMEFPIYSICSFSKSAKTSVGCENSSKDFNLIGESVENNWLRFSDPWVVSPGMSLYQDELEHCKGS
jgi:hypothetical protein